MKLKNKVALVTGGLGGIGAAIAHRFAAEGAKLALSDIAEGESPIVGVRVYRKDLTRTAACRELAEEVVGDFAAVASLQGSGSGSSSSGRY